MSQRVPDIAADNPAAFDQLLCALAGRPPIYVIEPNLKSGQVVWMADALPAVGLSPDLFHELAYQVARMRGGGTA